ncbi:hypothetical protein KKF91_22515 [Myxococcota bacterium]|nr:hypothetical protein [Myxococcota bacterium]
MSKRHPKILLVEGKSEVGSIPEILENNGIPWKKPFPVFIKNMGGLKNINRPKIQAYLQDSNTIVIGIVIDADDDSNRAWSSIRAHCGELVEDLPEVLDEGGFIGSSSRGVRFGVWVMPDNQNKGMFEDLLLASFKPESQAVKALSERFIEDGSQLIDSFNELHRSKSIINAWVALEEPGEPFWRESVLKKLDLTGPGLSPFVTWFKMLYELKEDQ